MSLVLIDLNRHVIIVLIHQHTLHLVIMQQLHNSPMSVVERTIPMQIALVPLARRRFQLTRVSRLRTTTRPD